MKLFTRSIFILLLAGILSMHGCFGGGGAGDEETPPGPTPSYPTVVSRSPSVGDTGIPVGATITAQFSKDMDSSTISGNFILKKGTEEITCSCSYSSSTKTASLDPDANLEYSTAYTAIITTDVADQEGYNLQSQASWSFTTGTEPDTTAPSVNTGSVSPANGAIDVSLDTAISIPFIENDEILTSTLNSTNIPVSDGSGTISGTYSYNDSTNTVTFTPTDNLTEGATCTVTVTTGVTDRSGNALTQEESWSFTTAIVPPTVTSTTPTSDATNVGITADIEIAFSEAMDDSTISSSTIQVNSGAVTGTVTYNSTTHVATFSPDSPLDYDTAYTVNVSTGVKDTQGNAMESAYSWSFTTAADTINPVISSISPSNGSTDVGVDSSIQVTFSETMDTSTINSSTFIVKDEFNNTVSGAYSYNSSTFTSTFTPSQNMIGRISYSVTLTTSIKDAAGNPLGSSQSASFTTEKSSTDWVIGVYIAADNNLSSAGATDLAEMAASNLNGRTVRVVALIDQEGTANTRLYEIICGTTKRLASTELGLSDSSSTDELNTGDPQTLSNFIQFIKNEFPSTNRALVMWNHGGGWRSAKSGKSGKVVPIQIDTPVKTGIKTKLFKDICWDETSANAYIGNDELQSAVKNQDIDLIAMDACLMGMIETAYELRKSVTGIDYAVFSQNTEPGDGYPYTTIINDFLAASDKSASNLASIIVSDYVASYASDSDVTQSAVNLGAIETVVTNLNSFTTFLGTQTQSELDNARKACEQYDIPWFVDLQDLANYFAGNTEADTLISSLSTAVIASNSGTGKPNASGLSIYFTTVTDMSDYDDTNNLNNIDFLDDSTWDNFINANTFGEGLDLSESGTYDNDVFGNFYAGNGCDYSALTIDPADYDVFTLYVTSAGTITVNLDTVPSLVDLDLYLLYFNGSDLVQVDQSYYGWEGEAEYLSYTASQTGYYALVVQPYNSYVLALDLVNYYHISFGGTASYTE